MNTFPSTSLRRTLASALTVFALLGAASASAATAAAPAPVAPVTVHWVASTEPTLAGYLVSYGTASGQYNTTIDVGMDSTFQLPNSSAATVYYFAVKSYDTEGQESAYSAEMSTAAVVVSAK